MDLVTPDQGMCFPKMGRQFRTLWIDVNTDQVSPALMAKNCASMEPQHPEADGNSSVQWVDLALLSIYYCSSSTIHRNSRFSIEFIK